MLLHIRNMVCPRCISSVERILGELNIEFQSVDLGEVKLKNAISDEQKNLLDSNLKKEGFERIDDHKSQLIKSIKSIIIQKVHYEQNELPSSWSEAISDTLHYEYKYLSQLFSSVEGITIEQYILKQKIEKVKELISYDNLTLSQIAFQLGYSSLAHLSGQFRKVTGMTPTEFKKLNKKPRISLDKV